MDEKDRELQELRRQVESAKIEPVRVYACSVCGWELYEKTDFCPHCGANMYELEGL